MTLSTTLQWKISKMKKRLSNDSWLQPIYCLAFMGLTGVAGFSLRAATVSWNFGVVETQLPVVHVPPEDKSRHQYTPKVLATLSQTSPLIAITDKSFIFGTLRAFGEGYDSVRNKYSISHQDGAPNVGELLSSLDLWINEQQTLGYPINSDIGVLLPDERVPVAVLIQVLSLLKQSKLFKEVILAEGAL